MKKVKETENEKLRKKIEHFLQNVYADEWHVKLVDNVYICYYTDIERMKIYYDTLIEEWYVSGESISMEMLYELYEFINEMGVF